MLSGKRSGRTSRGRVPGVLPRRSAKTGRFLPGTPSILGRGKRKGKR